ncbi:ketol-acid reductoisomerase [Marinomonas sp. MED121]|uniref:ketol-acid reductoisomerase n=1 Tax=Marinomonas sp. MED121 TaxID=314277 RepID=UPI0000690D91|nr:ketol-acid reductoisomerase [Marinomonas sp. MED121]EAQ65153.1 ketol-acid reductoisomerase [Marinomonas sp. MED121]
MSNISLSLKLGLIFSAGFLLACQSTQLPSTAKHATTHEALAQTYPAAIIEPKLVRDAIKIEKVLNERQDVPLPADQKSYKIVAGSQPIIITAPHSVRPYRNGKYRFSDGGGTAAYALALAELVGAHVIYAQYENKTDANFEDNNEFKRQLDSLIEQVKPKLVLDIHGSNPMRSYDVDIGNMNGDAVLGQNELVADLIEQLAKEGISSISYNRFSASTQQTIAKFASKRGVPSIQLEVNATYLMPSEGSLEAQRFAILLQALTRYLAEDVLDEGAVTL